MATDFNFDLSLEFLNQLTQGNIRENLAKGIRLWVILRSIYTDALLGTSREIDFAGWLEAFFPQFRDDHKKCKPHEFNHPHCNCTLSGKDWLNKYLDTEAVDHLQQTLLASLPTLKPQRLDKLLSTQPFRVGRRTLLNDFGRLCDLGWLDLIQNKQTPLITRTDNHSNGYQKVETYPITWGKSTDIVSPSIPINFDGIVSNSLADFFEDFSQEINGERRFLLDLEYIIHSRRSEEIEQLRNQLKTIWEQSPVPLIHLHYFSARNYEDRESAQGYLAYPVCLYYSQRVPYLFAFGQTPQSERLDWYDFRLDRISDLEPVAWTDPQVSMMLQAVIETLTPSNAFEDGLVRQKTATDTELVAYFQQECRKKNVQYLQDLKSQAWGFDFFRPIERMLLRFDRYFHDRYIKGTERDNIFQMITSNTVSQMIQNAKLPPTEKRQILQTIKAKSEDTYCYVDYREGDHNIIMRLRAWGSHVEVLAPLKLRQLMRAEAQKVAAMY